MLASTLRRSVAFLVVVLGCAPESDADPAETSGESGSANVDESESSSSPDADTSSETAAIDPNAPTYWADIKPIVDARCTGCHNADGVAPFGLTSFDEAFAYGEVMATAIEAGAMPPWPASPDCNEYLHDPSLDGAQIDTVRAWVDAGKPEGDPGDEGEPLPAIGAELPRIDLTAAMAEPHVPTPEEPGGLDEHRCFLVDFPADEEVFLRGYAVRPGNRRAAHHLVVQIIGPDEIGALVAADEADEAYGWACGAGTGMVGSGGSLLGAWVPGGGASLFPEGTGLRVPAGSKLLFNMHYNVVMGDVSPDVTEMDFMVESSVEREGRTVFVLDPTWPIGDNMLIPADDPSVVHEAEFSTWLLGGAIEVYSVGMHMHTLATSGSLTVMREGEEGCLVDIPRWDFGWQLFYDLKAGMRIEQGEEVRLRCEWDNSAANQPVVDGEQVAPRDVTWGEDTFDEMCMAIVYAVPAQ
jgi:hypothetical protein